MEKLYTSGKDMVYGLSLVQLEINQGILPRFQLQICRSVFITFSLWKRVKRCKNMIVRGLEKETILTC